MLMNLAGRTGPSGPKIELQLPFFGANGIDGTAPGVYYAVVGTGDAVIDGADVEVAASYMILQRGTLGTFLIQNVQTGPDPVNVTYRIRRNAQNVGTPVIIGNAAVGPIRVDLAGVGVSPGTLISIQATIPAYGGASPFPKIGLTWFPSG